jgi:hypothetical protein
MHHPFDCPLGQPGACPTRWRPPPPGINVNTLGIILLLTGLIAVLYSLLFWSSLSPWGRRRIVARRRTVVEERPVEVVEERPLDDGLP